MALKAPAKSRLVEFAGLTVTIRLVGVPVLPAGSIVGLRALTHNDLHNRQPYPGKLVSRSSWPGTDITAPEP